MNSIYVIVITFFTLMISGCDDSRAKARQKLFDMYSISLSSNNNLLLRYHKNFQPEHYRCAEFVDNHWVRSEECYSDALNITFDGGTMTYREGNDTLHEVLPTISEIGASLGMLFEDADISYVPFADGENHSWDKVTYLASIGTHRETECYANRTCYDKIFYLQLVKQSERWEIALIYSIHSTADISLTADNLFTKIDLLSLISYYSGFNLRSLSLKKYTPICFHNYGNLFIRKEGSIIKKYFYDVYPEAYLDTIIKVQSARHPDALGGINNRLAFYLDKEDSLHLFYNDLNNLDGKHILYQKYTIESPDIPVMQQTIYWD